MGTTARTRSLQLHPMCKIMRPNPARNLTNPPKNTKIKKNFFKKSRNNTKKIFKNQTKTTKQIQEVFPKEIHEFLVRTHQFSYRSRKNLTKLQNPANVNIQRYSREAPIGSSPRIRGREIPANPARGYHRRPPPPPAAGCPPLEGPTGDSCQAARCPPASLTGGQEASLPWENRTGARANADGR